MASERRDRAAWHLAELQEDTVGLLLQPLPTVPSWTSRCGSSPGRWQDPHRGRQDCLLLLVLLLLKLLGQLQVTEPQCTLWLLLQGQSNQVVLV